jgi:hypothetical protein
MCVSARLGMSWFKAVHVEIYKTGDMGIESGLNKWSRREVWWCDERSCLDGKGTGVLTSNGLRLHRKFFRSTWQAVVLQVVGKHPSAAHHAAWSYTQSNAVASVNRQARV